jgi:predicted methyltransferase
MKFERFLSRAWSVIALALLVSVPVPLACAQAARQAPPPAPAPQSPAPPPQEPAPVETERPTSEPYTGDLSIFEDEDRAKKLQIDRVMDILGIREGSRVADIGAGSGWFTVRAARRAGATGVVYAVEINSEFLDHIAKRAEREQLSNIKTVLGAEDDPRLPPSDVDAVLILKTYHEIAKPVTLMRHLRDALRPGALVGIIDRNGDGDDHGVDAEAVIQEVERAGFALESRHDFVKPDRMDYFLVFRVKAPSG